MRSRRASYREAVVWVVGLFVTLVVMGAFVLTDGVGTAQGREGSGTTTLVQVVPSEAPANCSRTALASLTTAPASAAVLPLENQLFIATAESACGTPPAQATSFFWWLSSPSLGTLNASGGATIAYTACVAPMDGVLHVRATSGGITRYANSSISVSGQSSSGTNPPPGAPSGSPSGGGLSIPRGNPWAGLGIMVAFVAMAGLVLYFGHRKRTRGRHER
jgi:hypothetical protein